VHFHGLISWIVRLFTIAVAIAINTLMFSFASLGGSIQDGFFLSPYMVFFNKIPLLSVNIFDNEGVSEIILNFRTSIATWYYVLRALSTAILLLMLVYVGIRIAISSGISDKVVYKKMIVDWAVSVAIIYLLHYFMVFVLYLNDTFVNILATLSGVANSSNANNVNEFTIKILEKAASWPSLGGGSASVISNLMAFMCLLVYIILFFQTVKYIFLYVKRMMTVCFLIIISPLITVTYSMDKMGDNKAQAFGAWLKEFLYNVFIQPFHCILYLVFANQAFVLLSQQSWGVDEISFGTAFGNGMLAILGILFINKGEDFIRHVFGFGKAGSLESTAAAAMTVAGLAKNAPKMVQTGKKMFNNGATKAIGSKLGNLAGKGGKGFANGFRQGKAAAMGGGAAAAAAADVGGKKDNMPPPEAGDISPNDPNLPDTNDKEAKKLEKTSKGFAAFTTRAGEKFGKFTGKQLQKLEAKSNKDMALKNVRKKHDYAKHLSDKEIMEDKDLGKEFNEELSKIESLGGASAIRENNRKTRAKKVAKKAKDGKVKATGEVPKSKKQRKETKVTKALHATGEWVSDKAKTAGHYTGKYISKGAKWLKDGAIAEWKSGRLLGTTTAMMAGLATLDATDDVLQSITATKMGYNASTEAWKNTNKTLETERDKLMDKRSKIDDNDTGEFDEAIEAMEKDAILRMGDAGQYEEKAIADAEKKMKKLLSSSAFFSGDDRAVNDFVFQMQLDMNSGKTTFSAAMDKNLGGQQLSPDSDEDARMKEEVRNYMKTLNEASLYKNMKTSMDTGKSREQVTGFTKEMAEAIVSGASYPAKRKGTKHVEKVTETNTGADKVHEAEQKIETHAEEVAREIKDNGDKIKDMTREKIREELKREEAEKEEEGNK